MLSIRRLFKHLLTTSRTGRRAFPIATLKSVEQAIAEGEALHRAEIRLIVEPALSCADLLSGLSTRERAKQLFVQYGIWDTEENCGVLIYINLADHKVEIITDRNVGRSVAAADWESICATMTQGFAQGAFQQSAIAALEQLNRLLQIHFPSNGERPNQLTNESVVL